MKANDLFRLLVNPFTRIAGWQALGLGLVLVAAMGLLGAASGVAFDGVFDMHLFKHSVGQAFGYLAIGLVCIVAVLWVAGLLSTRNFRFIDLLGTLALAKAPFLLTALAGFFVTPPDLSQIMHDPYVMVRNVPFLAMMVLSFPVMVWSITLLFNAFKVSCGLKGSRLTVSFILGLVLAEFVAKLLIHYLL
jgi:hypothetical protein